MAMITRDALMNSVRAADRVAKQDRIASGNWAALRTLTAILSLGRRPSPGGEPEPVPEMLPQTMYATAYMAGGKRAGRLARSSGSTACSNLGALLPRTLTRLGWMGTGATTTRTGSTDSVARRVADRVGSTVHVCHPPVAGRKAVGGDGRGTTGRDFTFRFGPALARIGGN